MKTIEYELKTLRYKQQMLAILVFSLVCVGFWVLVSIAQSQRSTQVDPELKRLARPLNPNINEDILRKLEQKRRFSDEELRDFPIYRIVDTGVNSTLASPNPTLETTLGTELQAFLQASPGAETQLSTTSAVVTNPQASAATSSGNLTQ